KPRAGGTAGVPRPLRPGAGHRAAARPLRSDAPVTERPVRLVVYTDAGGVGGAEICLGNLVAELAQSRYAITVLATDEAVGASVAARRPDGSLETVPSVRDKKDLPPIVAHLRALRRLRPQLVHLNLRTP